MSKLATESRWELIHDKRLRDVLDDNQREYLVALISEDLGYGPPPEDEIDEASPAAAPEPFIEQVRFNEVWHKGNVRFSRASNERKGFCFHHTAGRIAGSIAWIKQGSVPASYHMAVSPDGTQNRFVDDRFRSYSAGHGSLKGRNPNHVCLHVAVEGDTVTGKHRDTPEITDIEMNSIMDWCVPRFKKFNMSLDWCTDHRTVDPRRRNDLEPTQLKRILDELKRQVT